MSTRDHPDWWRPVGGSNSQDSTLERRSLIWNDDENILLVDRVRTETTDDWKGKFYTRGCRGKIEQLQIYSEGNAANTLTLNISPHPCLGPLYTVDITPGAVEGWWGANFRQMWNYDSLFIWITDVEALVSWWYDAFQPHDGHESANFGVTWAAANNRPFIRVVYSSETPGDVPVSGIVNTIEIPSTATEAASGHDAAVPTELVTTICTAVGAGTMLEAKLDFRTSVTPTPGNPPIAVRYQIRVLTDGFLGNLSDNRELTQSCVATSGRSSKGEFWQCTIAEDSWDRTFIRIRMPLKFRRSLTLQCVQSTGGPVEVWGLLYANMIR